MSAAVGEAASPHPLAEQLPALFRPLLDRLEARVLRMLADGLDHAEVAGELRREEAEIARIEATARAKLGLYDESRRAAARRAAQDDFLERFCAGLDGVLAPILVTLDSLDAYVDPRVTPDDYLDWLGGWVALGSRLRWPEESWRTLVAEAATLFRWRGTARVLKRFVELYTGGEVEVRDPGGSSVIEGQTEGDAATMLSEAPVVVVRVKGGRVDPSDPAQMEGLEHIVRQSVPAHLPHWLEVKP